MYDFIRAVSSERAIGEQEDHSLYCGSYRLSRQTLLKIHPKSFQGDTLLARLKPNEFIQFSRSGTAQPKG
jgi:hypothetical protein